MAACASVMNKGGRPMKAHRYTAGEHVLYTEQRFPHLISKQPYTIVQCLDSRRHEPQYQIRSAARPYDCVAGEDELSQDASPMNVFHEPDFPTSLDFGSMSAAANLNLVPWASLPRRVHHKNEQTRLSRH
jgi:hypothetical protein